MERISQPVGRPLTPEKVFELLYGEDAYCLPEYYRGYGDARSGDLDMTHFISEEMRADWFANRDKLMMLWNGEATEKELFGHYRRPWLISPRENSGRPWAAQVFDDDDDQNAT
jgi:hypothetical protein